MEKTKVQENDNIKQVSPQQNISNPLKTANFLRESNLIKVTNNEEIENERCDTQI